MTLKFESNFFFCLTTDQVSHFIGFLAYINATFAEYQTPYTQFAHKDFICVYKLNVLFLSFHSQFHRRLNKKISQTQQFHNVVLYLSHFVQVGRLDSNFVHENNIDMAKTPNRNQTTKYHQLNIETVGSNSWRPNNGATYSKLHIMLPIDHECRARV